MVDYIDRHREEFGVEPICEVLQFAPSTYYAVKTRMPSARALHVFRLASITKSHPLTFIANFLLT